MKTIEETKPHIMHLKKQGTDTLRKVPLGIIYTIAKILLQITSYTMKITQKLKALLLVMVEEKQKDIENLGNL